MGGTKGWYKCGFLENISEIRALKFYCDTAFFSSR